LSLQCPNEPPKRNELGAVSETIIGAFKLQNKVILVIKSISRAGTTYQTLLRSVDVESMTEGAQFSFNARVSSFDYLVDGPSGLFSFVGHTGPTSVSLHSNQEVKQSSQPDSNKIYVVKIEFTSQGNLVYTTPKALAGNVHICPKSVSFESTSDSNQKTRFIVRSQCIGEAADIQEVVTNSDYSKITKVTRKRIIHESGYQICSTKGEILVFVPRKRKLYAFNLGNTDRYEYPLKESGINVPLMMNCVPDKNLVQIVGYTGENIMLANFIGGNSEEPSSRLHSAFKLEGVTKSGY
jgi:hypothetical protein